MEKTDKEKLNEIYLEIVGQPEFNRKGMRKQLDDVVDDVEKLKEDRKSKKWFWTGWGAAGGATLYAGAKSSTFAKIIAAIASAFGMGSDKMIK